MGHRRRIEMIEDIGSNVRWVKAQDGDESAAHIVSPNGVYKLQVLVDGVWLDLPRPEDEGESR